MSKKLERQLLEIDLLISESREAIEVLSSDPRNNAEHLAQYRGKVIGLEHAKRILTLIK